VEGQKVGRFPLRSRSLKKLPRSGGKFRTPDRKVRK